MRPLPANNPARLEQKVRKVDDGLGGLIDQKVRFPVWVDPVANGGTPMCQVFALAHDILEKWLVDHPDGFPPTVINITDGESTDGVPSFAMHFLTDLKSTDGSVLLFNIHLSSLPGVNPIVFPDSEEVLPDNYARVLFHGTSNLTSHMRALATEYHHSPKEGAKGFILNADPTLVITALEIGTRPSNMER